MWPGRRSSAPPPATPAWAQQSNQLPQLDFLNNLYAAQTPGGVTPLFGQHPTGGAGQPQPAPIAAAYLPQQQSLYGYGVQTPISDNNAFLLALAGLEQRKQQALHDMVRACTDNGLYPSQYQYPSYGAPAPSLNEGMPQYGPFGYFSQNQPFQATSNTEIRPNTSGSFPNPKVPHDATDGILGEGSKYHQGHRQGSYSGSQATTSSNRAQQPVDSTSKEAYQGMNEDPLLSGMESIIVLQENQLRQITNDFSNVLGNGSFGMVYRGTLVDGRHVAVKVPMRATETDMTDFRNELRIQSRIKHRNVVKLLGYCLEGGAPKLVYEFAGNGNLYEKLHGKNRIPLSLDIRLRIALECAEGLSYIHSSTDTCILHGDVKSENILLDDNFTAKVSDFGLSRLLSTSSSTMYTQTVRGSFGYMDPMFKKVGILTQKSDVYSFGVVLVELITRKKARDEVGTELAESFQSCFARKKTSVHSIVDKEIATKNCKGFVEEIAQLAFECLSADVKDRPEMKKVAHRLIGLYEKQQVDSQRI